MFRAKNEMLFKLELLAISVHNLFPFLSNFKVCLKASNKNNAGFF